MQLPDDTHSARPVPAPAARSRSTISSSLHRLPEELLIEILSRLFQDSDPQGAFHACQLFHRLQVPALKHFCRAHWPARFEAAQSAIQEGSEIFQLAHVIKFLRTEDLARATWVPASAAVAKQETLLPEHRGILAEWIVEVVYALKLGRDLAVKATAFFDRHLQQSVLKEMIRFQLVGVSCLCAAAVQEGTFPLDKLDAPTYAYMTDNAYTPEQIESETAALLQQHPDPIGPVASTFLAMQQSLAARSRNGLPLEPRVDIVNELSWMLLELALMSTPCSSLPPSHLATAALSLALEALGTDPHPPFVTATTALRPADIQPACEAIWQLQQSEPAACLRGMWRAKCMDGAALAASTGQDELRRMYCWLAAMVEEPRALVPYPHMRNLYPPPVVPPTV